MKRRARMAWPFLMVAPFLMAGCANPSLSDQANLSRPGMVFAESPAYSAQPDLLSSIEPGTDTRGGASASGCTACQ